ncbi:hypothetical protein [Carnobacterium maltaromaticum]|uniref:hypothetical protein n=1 Tax=Carnobacterium maltaromaticum TaxID=2751 RepID=UPI0039B10EEC
MVILKVNIQDASNRITGLKSVIENYSSEVDTLIWHIESRKNNLSELDQDIINSN